LFLTNKRVKKENSQQASISISNLTQIVVCLYNVSAQAPARNVTVEENAAQHKHINVRHWEHARSTTMFSAP
jgi:hypothetical protein